MTQPELFTSEDLPKRPTRLPGESFARMNWGIPAGLLIGWVIMSAIRGEWNWAALVGTLIAIVIAMGIVRPLARARYRKAARHLLVPAGGFVCLKCHYPLTGNADEGVCPECDMPYTRYHTIRTWREYSPIADQLPRPTLRSK